MPQEYLECKTDAPIKVKVIGNQNKLKSGAAKNESHVDTTNCT